MLSASEQADNDRRKQPRLRYRSEETSHDGLGRDADHHEDQPRSVTDTVPRLTGIRSAEHIKLFAVINQSAQARQAGIELRETTLVIFGNPAMTGSSGTWVVI